MKYISLLIIIFSQLFFSSSLFAVTVGEFNKNCMIWKNQNYDLNFIDTKN